MTDSTGSRLLALLALAVLGVTLAGVGALLGGVTATDSAGEFRVSDRNVTFADGGQNRTLVGNLTGIDRVELERVGAGRYQIRTERATPLSGPLRERAERIVRENDTVRRALARMDSYELSVEPIRRLSVGEGVTLDTEPIDGASVNGTAESMRFRIANESRTDGSERVVVDRAPEYVDGEVNVDVAGPEGETRYFVHVDLRNGTVVDVTDFGDA